MLLKPTLLHVIHFKNRSGEDIEVIHPNHRTTLTECLDRYTNHFLFTLISVKTYSVGEEL